ncbi:MAG: STN domain-containing protein, partial [Bacteroidales bacterium]
MHLTYFNNFGGRVVLLLISCIFLCSFALHAQQLKLLCKDTPLKTVLKEITKQTGYSFAYSNALKQVNTNITCDINSNEPINKVLKTLLDGKGITFTITGKQIILAPDSIAIKEAEKAQPQR